MFPPGARLLLLLACTHPSAAPDGVERVGDNPDDPVYDPDVLHEVVITLDPADLEALRTQRRTYWDLLDEGCMEGPFPSPYTYFPGQVTFDGHDLGTVGVRKKGLIGSDSYERPSVRIDVDHYTDNARFFGLEHLVLNNNNQDESRLRSCLAHALYADAGLVAPRCALAHVVVNGEDMGVYANTEAIDPELVKRVRGAAPTTLYEGAMSDFREGWLPTFEAKTDASDGADLEAVVTALESDDDALLAALEEVVDLDAFFTFWAAESLVGQSDGYNGNANNFYVYGAPEDGRLEFIGGGPDAAFNSRSPFGPGPSWVVTASALSNRLFAHPTGRARFEAELLRLLDDVWDEDAAVARVATWKELAHDALERSERRAADDLEELVALRAGDLRDAIGGDVEIEPLQGQYCWSELGSVAVTFDTTWGSYPGEDAYTTGSATALYDVLGVTHTPSEDGVTVGTYGNDAMWYAVSRVGPEEWLASSVVFDPDDLADGAVIAIDGHAATGNVLRRAADTGGRFLFVGYLAGDLSFEAADDTDGAAVRGTLSARILAGE